MAKPTTPTANATAPPAAGKLPVGRGAAPCDDVVLTLALAPGVGATVPRSLATMVRRLSYSGVISAMAAPA